MPELDIQEWGAVAAIVIAVLAVMSAIIKSAGWAYRRRFPVRIRAGDVYLVTYDNESHPEVIVHATIENRTHEVRRLRHFYLLKVTMWWRMTHPRWRRGGEHEELELVSHNGWPLSPDIPKDRGVVDVWATCPDRDLLIRTTLLGRLRRTRRLTVQRDAWLVAGFDGRKASKRLKRRRSMPDVPRFEVHRGGS